MASPHKPETFLFGIMTGIALVASVQYFLSFAKRPKQSIEASLKQHQKAVQDRDSVLAMLDTELVITSSRLQRIVLHMVSEFKKGLNAEGEMIQMLPSFVINRPTGTEIGSVLALDLGGTNFRVCKVGLEGYGKIRMSNAKYTVSDELKVGPGEKLFDFFADSVANFCKEQGIEAVDNEEPVPLGFTFSFPVRQTRLDAGILTRWTKGFSAPGVEGQEIVGLLNAAFARKSLKIKVKAIVNDTVGTLIAHSYSDPQTYIGVILGTGTNAAYVEKIENVKKWNAGDLKGEVVVNTEWGNYSEPSILRVSKWDEKLDRHSQNPKKQIFEKMISGMYLGEISRLIIMDLIKSGELFQGVGSKKLTEKDSFESSYMARAERYLGKLIASDHSLGLSDIKQLFEDVLEVPKTTVEDRRVIKHICELVGTRAARLAAAGIAALVTKINKLDGCTVAIDGSVYEHYPHFGNRMRDALRELLGITAQNIILEQARDGSGQGAALVAALAE